MKFFTAVWLFCAFSAALASPIAEYRWNLLPDGKGKMHLVDVQPNSIEPERLFNPEVDTAFLLFTRSNPTVGQRITWTAGSISGSNFNAAHPVRVLIHGFNSGPQNDIATAPTREYLARGNFNVIAVDWSIGANTINYITARNRVPLVADVLARFLNFLVSNGSTQWTQINIAGHSLGAHIAGITGKRTAGRIQTIFGLDPGAPLFSLGAPDDRLDANDAVQTQGLRTNAGNLGFAEPFCHSDFYPNWGTTQTGCGIDVAGSCSHSRAHEFFAESITSNRFVARRCANYEQITSRNCPPGQGTGTMGGEPWSPGLMGIYFLETNGARPFAQG